MTSYELQALTFAPSKREVTAVWQNFWDDESPLISYTLELLAQAKCDATVQPGGDMIASVSINYTLTTYTFRDLDLTVNSLRDVDQEGDIMIDHFDFIFLYSVFCDLKNCYDCNKGKMG